MRYRPSAMGFESQLKSGGEESVPNCIHSQWRAWDSAAVCEQGRGAGSGWMGLHKTCQGQGCKGTLLQTNCVYRHMENSSKNQANLVDTVRSSHKQGILGLLLPCHCGKVRDDNIIPVVVIQTTECLMTLVAAKNMGGLSFLPFLLENYTHPFILVFKIFVILFDTSFPNSTTHICISHLLLCIPYSSITFHFWKGKNNFVF